MPVQNLRSINLNLLPILRQVLLDRNVTRAARALSLSQPTVSKALARLRAIFGDPLLMREGRAMILTPRAERLLPEVDAQCRRLQSLWSNEEFDPATTRRRFVIAATDYEALALLPEIGPILREQAPSASISFSEISGAIAGGSLANVDLLVGPDETLAPILGAETAKVMLFRETFVTIIPSDASGKTHAGRDRPVDYGRQLIFNPAATSRGPTSPIRDLQATDPFATLPNFTVLPILAVLTGSPALVPRMVARRFADYLPITIDEDAQVDLTATMVMAWHPRWNIDPGHRWFRDLIAARCGQI